MMSKGKKKDSKDGYEKKDGMKKSDGKMSGRMAKAVKGKGKCQSLTYDNLRPSMGLQNGLTAKPGGL